MRSEVRIQLKLFSRRLANCPIIIYWVIYIFLVNLKLGYYQILIICICLSLFVCSMFIISLIYPFLHQYQIVLITATKCLPLYAFPWLFSLPTFNIYLFLVLSVAYLRNYGVIQDCKDLHLCPFITYLYLTFFQCSFLYFFHYTLIWRDICLPMFIAALFTMAKRGSNLNVHVCSFKKVL